MKLPNIFIATFISLSLVCCKSNKDSGVPDNAINPDVMNNPASATGTKDKTKVPVLEFEEESHDFGKMTEGEKLQYAFKFKNVGTGDLVIRSANGSCGCTVPEWPKEAIPPGGKGVINITFDSAGKTGMQHKTITIISNTVPNTKVLNIHGEVASADGSLQKSGAH